MARRGGLETKLYFMFILETALQGLIPRTNTPSGTEYPICFSVCAAAPALFLQGRSTSPERKKFTAHLSGD